MTFYEYPTGFIAGLCAFVRQAALSVDRAFADSFQADLRSYYSNGIAPSVGAVLEGLRTSSRRRILPLTALVMRSRAFLSQKDLDRVEVALLGLASLLDGQERFTHAQRMSLRLELSHVESMLYGKLSKTWEDEIRSVEHYHQADVVQLRSLREIVGDNWPMQVPT
ncbi:MAG: hypothetical protein AAGE85_12470 [Pseudomonadota bacterium]